MRFRNLIATAIIAFASSSFATASAQSPSTILVYANPAGEAEKVPVDSFEWGVPPSPPPGSGPGAPQLRQITFAVPENSLAAEGLVRQLHQGLMPELRMKSLVQIGNEEKLVVYTFRPVIFSGWQLNGEEQELTIVFETVSVFSQTLTSGSGTQPSGWNLTPNYPD